MGWHLVSRNLSNTKASRRPNYAHHSGAPQAFIIGSRMIWMGERGNAGGRETKQTKGQWEGGGLTVEVRWEIQMYGGLCPEQYLGLFDISRLPSNSRESLIGQEWGLHFSMVQNIGQSSRVRNTHEEGLWDQWKLLRKMSTRPYLCWDKILGLVELSPKIEAYAPNVVVYLSLFPPPRFST